MGEDASGRSGRMDDEEYSPSCGKCQDAWIIFTRCMQGPRLNYRLDNFWLLPYIEADTREIIMKKLCTLLFLVWTSTD